MKKQKKTTGIRLERRWTEKSSERDKNRIYMLVPVFYMMLGIYGWMRTALDLAGISEMAGFLYGGILLFGIWFGILYLAKKWQLALFAVSLAVFGLVVWKNFEAIQTGIFQIMEAFLYARSAESGGVYSSALLAETRLALFCVLFVLYCMFLGFLCTESGKYLVILWMVIPVSASLIFGEVPDGLGVFCMVFAALGLNVSQSEQHDPIRGKSALFAGAAALLLLTVGSMAAESVLAPWFEGKEEVRARIQQTSLIQTLLEFSPSWSSEDSAIASGGVSDGTFNNTDFFMNTGEVLFQVSQTEEPQSSLYLRVYTGTEYTKSKWKKKRDKEPAAEVFYERAAAAAYSSGYAYPCTVSIDLGEENRDDYPYAPYFSKEQEETEGNVLQYQYYPISQLGALFTEAVDEASEEYRDYVYDTYLDYPAESLPRFLQFCRENPRTGIEEICNTVRDFLYENASYNPQVGQFPEEEDFAEYFLFEQKEGYCVHFATSAVLLMRMYGVPARYVTGFAVARSDFKEDGDVWTAGVKDSRAHAWAEIYVDNYGWIPFETTPSYDSGANLESPETAGVEIPSEEQETQNLREQEESGTEKRAESNRDSAGKSENNRVSGKGSVGIGLTGFLLIVLLLAGVAAFLRREMILKRRGKQGAAEIFQDMYEVLEFGGMPGSLDCMDEDFTKKVTEQFLWIDKEELDKVMEIVMRANYSDEITGKEEILQVRSMYRHICRMLLKGMTGWKRFCFRFVKVYL